MDNEVDLDVRSLLTDLLVPNLLSEKQIFALCDMAKKVLKEEPNVKKVLLPVYICADVQGNFFELRNIFEHIGGPLPDHNYLFLGDYVDRGYHSIETICYLMALKILYPERLTLLRGHHDSRQITQIYGFYDECRQKNRSACWEKICSVFDHMPIAAIVGDQIFCVHSGLSPSADTIDDLQKEDRFQEIPHEGIVCDLMWSTPEDRIGWGISHRGAGYTFGSDITESWLTRNELTMMVTSRMSAEGFEWHHEDRLLILFSVPNYCYREGNPGAILYVTEAMEYRIILFEASWSPQPSKNGSTELLYVLNMPPQ